MAKSIEQLKHEIKFRRKFKDDPTGAFKDVASLAIGEALDQALEQILPELFEAIVSTVTKNLRSNQELADLITAQVVDEIEVVNGYTPVKGKDYFTDQEQRAFIRQIKDSITIPKAKEGKTPVKGKDYFTESEKRELITRVIDRIKQEIKPESASDVVAKINQLPIKAKYQIDAKHIKNLPNIQEGAKLGKGKELARGGLKLIWNTILEGQVNGINTIFTIPAALPKPKDNKYLVEARGAIKSIDGGDFTISNGNRTVTFVAAPPEGSSQPRIILYQA